MWAIVVCLLNEGNEKNTELNVGGISGTSTINVTRYRHSLGVDSETQKTKPSPYVRTYVMYIQYSTYAQCRTLWSRK